MKQDLRIIKTHKALCETFITMLEEKNFEEITVNELCERAMVRRATFYKHFADKYDFFSFFIRDIRSKLLNNQKNNDNDCDNYYTNLFKQYIGFLTEHKSLVNSVINSSVFPTLFNILTDEIQRDIHIHLMEEQEKGREFPMSLGLLSAFYAGGIIQISRYYITSATSLSSEDLIKNFEEIISFN